MAENSKIEWCDHTFNPWIGCTKISTACDNCYAEGWAKRTGQIALWQGERRRTTPANWNLPLKWNAQAEREGRRYRVFCASLADVFDNQVPDEWRTDLWTLIATTKSLDWLLLTKRPQNIAKMLPDHRVGAQPWGDGWPNVWLGTTVENQQQADLRIPHLLSVRARVHFLSCEPSLGPLNFRWTNHAMDARRETYRQYLDRNGSVDQYEALKKIDWVIAGGESGPNARPMHPDWARGLRDQCADAGVPFFFKQWGEWAPQLGAIDIHDDNPERSRFTWAEWTDWGSGEWHWDIRKNPQWCDEMDADHSMVRVGKKRAGRLLDGREHNEFPPHA